jgi:hypothetical protein
MLGRALSLAAVTLLIGCLTAGAAWAAENLDAGKSPSQIFSSTCSACHKSPRGLLKNTSASSLPGFLRQHYTTGTDMASQLSSFLIANGAADPRYQGKDQPKRGARQKEANPAAREDQPERTGRRQPSPAPAQEVARPEPDGAAPQGEGGRPDRSAKRFSRRNGAPEAKPSEGEVPVQAATDSKPRTGQKHGRRGRPAAQEPPKDEQTARGDAAKDAPSRDVARPPEPIKPEPSKPETAPSEPDKAQTVTTSPAPTDAIGDAGDKPAGETTKPAGGSLGESKPSDTAKLDRPGESAGSEPTPLRSDSAPPAPATATPEPSTEPASAAPSSATATAPASPTGPTPPVSR